MKKTRHIRTLLVNPWIYDFACYDLFSKPIGLLQIATLLERNGLSVNLIDCLDRLHHALTRQHQRQSAKSVSYGCGNYHTEVVKKPTIFKDIPRNYKRYGMPGGIFKALLKNIEKPDVILVSSGMTYWYQGAFEAVAILREKFPRVPIILGGIYATLCFKHAERTSGADIVFKGTDVKEICQMISKLLKIRLQYNGEDISCAYELYPVLKYATIRTSTGCPYRCSYCGWYCLNSKFLQRYPQDVCDEIDNLYKKRGIHNFAFYDDALFFNPQQHIIKILKEILIRKISANFHTPNGLHARFLDKELADLLKKSGFIQPRFGFESSNVNRQMTTGGKVESAHLKNAVRLLKDAGYAPEDIGVYLLIGLPNQSIKEIKDSIIFTHKLGIRTYLEEYSPVPGTADYEKSGLDKDVDPLMHNNCAFPLYNPKRYGQFQKLKDLNHRLNRR